MKHFIEALIELYPEIDECKKAYLDSKKTEPITDDEKKLFKKYLELDELLVEVIRTAKIINEHTFMDINYHKAKLKK